MGKILSTQAPNYYTAAQQISAMCGSLPCEARTWRQAAIRGWRSGLTS